MMVVCLSCASVFRDPGSGPIICPECGCTVERARYERIARGARDASHYGHTYRKIYERDGLERRYRLEPSDLLTFVAMAILSGVAYDTVKVVAKKIIESCKANSLPGAEGLDDPGALDSLVANVQSYLRGMPDADESVRDACTGELYTEEYARAAAALFAPALKGEAEPPTLEDIKRALESARHRIETARGVTKEDFEGAWLNVTM